MKLILFDFDGVIVDTEQTRFKKLQSLAKKEGIIILNERFSDIVGKKTQIFLKELNLNEEIIKKLNFELHKLRPIFPLIEGVADAIKILSKNYKLAIVTGSGKEIVTKTLEHYKLKEKFSFVISGEDFASSKPNPECYKLAIKKSEQSIQDILVIEDSEAGIISAKKAGLVVWALKTEYNHNQMKNADKIICSHKELMELLNKKQKKAKKLI